MIVKLSLTSSIWLINSWRFTKFSDVILLQLYSMNYEWFDRGRQERMTSSNNFMRKLYKLYKEILNHKSRLISSFVLAWLQGTNTMTLRQFKLKTAHVIKSCKNFVVFSRVNVCWSGCTIRLLTLQW